MGRPKYKYWTEKEGLDKITEWARIGLNNEQIFRNMGVSSKTFYQWLNEHSEISEALEQGRRHSVETLENAMFKKATGFYEGDKYYPPDNTSLMFLLRNWDREHYQDKPKTQEELESIRLDNKLKQYKIEQLELLLTDKNPTVDKINEFINLLKADAEASDTVDS